jgi:MoxR-like ATPase
MTVNALHVTPHEAYETLCAAFEAQLEFGMCQSYMLHGEPGVGKTRLVEMVAKRFNAKFYDVRLTNTDIADLRGLPYYCHETETTKYFRPQDVPHGDELAVFFLDEITACEPHVQPTAYGITEERRIGQFVFPKNVLIIGAGNKTDDGAVAYEMNTAISDRMSHMVVTQNVDSWLKDFAEPEELHISVIAHIKTHPDVLHTIQQCLADDLLIATTGRSWERVSDIRKYVKGRRAQEILIAGRVGEAQASSYWITADDVDATVKVVDMVGMNREDRYELYPQSLMSLNAMVYGVIGYMTEKNMEACIEIMTDLGNLSTHLPDVLAYRQIPMDELMTHGMDGIMTKALRLGLGVEISKSPAYSQYHAKRGEDGLNDALTA